MSSKPESPRFRLKRARMGGAARAKSHSRLWQQLMMFYLTEKRAGRTAVPTYQEWLAAHGLERVGRDAKVK